MYRINCILRVFLLIFLIGFLLTCVLVSHAAPATPDAEALLDEEAGLHGGGCGTRGGGRSGSCCGRRRAGAAGATGRRRESAEEGRRDGAEAVTARPSGLGA